MAELVVEVIIQVIHQKEVMVDIHLMIIHARKKMKVIQKSEKEKKKEKEGKPRRSVKTIVIVMMKQESIKKK